MMPASLAPPLVIVGLKAYFSHARTREWFDGLSDLVGQGRADGLTLVVIPSATALATLTPQARVTGVVLAAQDCSRFPAGPHTGELPASLLAEVGATVVEIGHAERRRDLGETAETVAAKVRAATVAGLVPMLCVGEQTRGTSTAAAAAVVRQLEAALDGVPATASLIVAYEPAWAIGAEEPAPPTHVVEVADRVRDWLRRYSAASLVYGGTAGPGTYREIAGAVDGLGLGRRVHDLAGLAHVLDEVLDVHGRRESKADR